MNIIESRAAGRSDALVWKLVEKLDEQRQYPRIPLDLKIAMRNDRGDKFSALALDISPDGLQLRCDVQAARQIHPAGGKINPTKRPLVSMAVTLPVGAGKRTLVALCELLYITTVDSEPRCVLGLGFGQLDAQSAAIISAFFADQLGVDHAASFA
jgi:hypothetical protein